MSHEARGRRWAGEPVRPVADYFDKLMTQLEQEAPLDSEAQSMRYDELACMRRALAVAAGSRIASNKQGIQEHAAVPICRPLASPSSEGRCTAALSMVLSGGGSRSRPIPHAAPPPPPPSQRQPVSHGDGIDELLAPKSRAELALRRRALWSDEGERAACDLLGKWNGEFKRLVSVADEEEVKRGLGVATYSCGQSGASSSSTMATVPANVGAPTAASASDSKPTAGPVATHGPASLGGRLEASESQGRGSGGGSSSGSGGRVGGNGGASGRVGEELQWSMDRRREDLSATRAAEAAESAARAAEAAARAATATAEAARSAFEMGRGGSPEDSRDLALMRRRAPTELRGETGWQNAWRPVDTDGPPVSRGPMGKRHALPLPSSDTGAPSREYLASVPRPHGAKTTAAPPSWSHPHVPTQEERDDALAVSRVAAKDYTCAGPPRFTAGGGVSLMPAAAATAAHAASSAAGIAVGAAATAKNSNGAPTVSYKAASEAASHDRSPRAVANSALRARATKRRRWFKTVAVVMAKRGGRDTHRFVDIANGISEFHFGRTTTRYDGSLLVGPVVPAHGFEVAESVHAALALTFPPDSRYIHAPRALLEVMVGGQPQLLNGRIYFVSVTPVRLLADPERYAALHRELYGDEYYLPAPPLPTATQTPLASPAAVDISGEEVSDVESEAEAMSMNRAKALADAAATAEAAEQAKEALAAHLEARPYHAAVGGGGGAPRSRSYSAKELIVLEKAAAVPDTNNSMDDASTDDAEASALGVSAALSAAAKALAQASDSSALSSSTKATAGTHRVLHR